MMQWGIDHIHNCLIRTKPVNIVVLKGSREYISLSYSTHILQVDPVRVISFYT